MYKIKRLSLISALFFTLALLVSLLTCCGGVTPNTIAFMSYDQDTGSVNVYLADLNGENLIKLSGDLSLGTSIQPAWSPGGDRIAFFSPNSLDLGNDIHTLHIVDNRGNGIASVDDIPGRSVSDSVWSPDASKIAFISNNEDDTFSVYMTDGNGNNLSLLDTVSGSPYLYGQTIFSPLWSPDSSKVCVNTMINRFDTLAVEFVDELAAYVIDTQGNKLISLDDSGKSYAQPRWSPDGGKLMYTFYDGESSNVYVINADGTGMANLTQGNYGPGPSGIWLPGSDKIILYTSIDDNYETYIINSNGTEPIQLTPDVDNYRFARPSPDGSKMLLSTLKDNHYEYYVMDTEGSEPIRLAEPLESVHSLSWSPDGSKIVFTSFNKEQTEANWERTGIMDRVYDIYVVNADGTGLIKVASENTEQTYPLWFPDSQRIIFSTGPYASAANICVVNTDGTGLINLSEELETHNWSPVVPPAGH